MRKKKEVKVEVAPINPDVPRGDGRVFREVIPLFGTTLRLIDVPGSRRCGKCFSSKEILAGFEGDAIFCKACVEKHGSDLTFHSEVEGK